ncbi:hypothetical protein [Vibrio alginolyticus]|uniref:hypothetical protein n=1 Tax=Vibrio alginolyticus TaxID=663 RepID=UPI001BD40590|nr:hypothetical protein [Vibrio alginolyticus]MBS9921710.1 hypothetical protein [Vibrio alginolyticus]
MEIMDYEIENKAGFFSAVLGLIASLVMAMGSIGWLGSIADVFSDWGDINHAVAKLHSYDVNNVGSKALLLPTDEGFDEFNELISMKTPWLKYRTPDAYLMNTPATFGGAPTKVVHVIYNNQAKSIAEFYIIENWISQEKQRDFLYKGLIILFASFLVSMSQFVKRGL